MEGGGSWLPLRQDPAPARAAMLDRAGVWGPRAGAPACPRPGGGQGMHGCPPPPPQHHEADLPLCCCLLRGTSLSSISGPLWSRPLG